MIAAGGTALMYWEVYWGRRGSVTSGPELSHSSTCSSPGWDRVAMIWGGCEWSSIGGGWNTISTPPCARYWLAQREAKYIYSGLPISRRELMEVKVGTRSIRISTSTWELFRAQEHGNNPFHNIMRDSRIRFQL